jgi:hypothetical protein
MDKGRRVLLRRRRRRGAVGGRGIVVGAVIAAAAVAGEGHEVGLDGDDIDLQVVVVRRDVSHRPPGQHRDHALPPVRRVLLQRRRGRGAIGGR